MKKTASWPSPTPNPKDLSVYELDSESSSTLLHQKFDHLIEKAFKCDEDFLEQISDVWNFQNDQSTKFEKYYVSIFRKVLNCQW